MLFALLVVLAGVPVSGRVVDAESWNPIAGAHVALIPERNWTGPAGGLPEAITDQNGRFVLEAVHPGRYYVNATKIGFVAIADPTEMPALEIVEGRAFTGVELSLTKGAAMTGRIVDASGEPLSGIMVSALKQALDRTSNRMMALTAQMTQTNDLGEFRLAGLQEGRYAVIAAPAPPPPFGQATAVMSGSVLAPTYYPGTTNKDAADIIAVATAQTVTGLQFSLVATPAYQVSGIVVDEAGTPLNGSMVMLLLDSRDGGTGAPLMGRSDETGTFRINGVVPGPYRMMASTPTMWATQDGSAVIGGGGGGAGGGGLVAVGGVFVGGSSLGGPGVPPPMPTTTPAPIEVTVDNADVTGLKVVVMRR
jgi:hypothetical protein